jgi:hypothetical protein
MVRLLRNIAVVAAVLSLSATLLAACSTGGTGSTPEPPAEPQLGLFTAHDECVDDETGTRVCDRSASDPRMTGEARISSTGGPSGVPIESIGILWSSFDLSNDDGEWACKDFIIGETENGVGRRDQVCVGKGGYEGLTAYTQSTTPDTATTWAVLGWIENDQ